MDKRERIISENIRVKRIKQYYTQEEFSEEIGISTNFLYRIEASTARMSLPTLLRILAVLGVDANTLLGQVGDSYSPPKYLEEILQILLDCEEREIIVILENMKQLKKILRKVYE